MIDSVKPVKSVSIIGCGDIGRRVAQQLLSQAGLPAAAITGYARSAKSLSRISQQGIGAKQLDLDNLSATSTQNTTDFDQQLVFYFAPPPKDGTTDTRIRAWLASLDPEHLPRRILYISTSGVYGDQQGKTISEQTTPHPRAARARRRLDAEQALSQFVSDHSAGLSPDHIPAHFPDHSPDHSIDFVILRVPGIYGAQRLPRKRLEQQVPILLPELSPVTNHIHEDDLRNICVNAALKSNSGEIYNVADNDHMTMSDYFIRVAEHLNLPIPPMINWQQAETTLSKGMLSYLKESRIIDNSKLLNKLGIVLKYPSLSDFFNLYS